MAKQKLKLKLDGSSSLDQAFDLPDFDFEVKPPKDDRKPATAIPKAVMRGTIKGLEDTSFVNRVVRTTLPPVFGEVDDLRKQARQGVRTLYNSAAKEIKPAMNDLARSIDKVVPEELKRLKKGIQKIKEWTSETKYKSDYDEDQQREANIALEIGQVFKSTLMQKDRVDQDRIAQDRAQRKIESVLTSHHNDRQLALLNDISRNTDISTQYTINVNARFQESLLKVQYKSYYMLSDMLVQMKATNAETMTELKAITKNTGLPEFVKLRKSEAFQEQLRNRFISDLNTGLFGGREGFAKGFFERAGRKIRDKSAELASTFSSSALALNMSAQDDDPFGPKKSMGEKLAQQGGEAGIQMLAMYGGNKVNHMLRKNAKLGKFVKDAEYGVKNIPQGMKQFGNKIDYTDNILMRLSRALVQAGMGPTGPIGKLQVDQVYSGDPNDPNTLRSASQFSRQNSKSLNEIIPGYLARIFREIQVLRTGDTNIGLTTYDYNKNKFLDSKNVAKSALKSILGDNNKEAHQEKIKELFGDLDKDGQLSEEERDTLVKFLTSENFKGNMMSQERLTNARIYSKSGLDEKTADKFAGIFDSYYSSSEAGSLQAKEKRNSLNNRLNSLGSEFNDSRAMIQELINMGQYETVRQLGLINEKNNSINFEKLIELYTDKKTPSIKGYSDSRKNLLTPGVSATTGNYVSNQSSSIPVQEPVQSNVDFDMSPVTSEIQRTNDILQRLEQMLNNRLSSIVASTHTSASVGVAQLDPSKIDAVKKAITDHIGKGKETASKGVAAGVDSVKGIYGSVKSLDVKSFFSSLGAKVSGKSSVLMDTYGKKKDELMEQYRNYRQNSSDETQEQNPDQPMQSGDPSVWASMKNIHRKTTGRVFGIVHPMAKMAVGAIKPGANVIKTIGRVGFNFTKSGVERLIDIRDVYVEGEDSPRLIASVLRSGGYFDAKTGKPIRRLFQIKGDVVDKNGEVVLKASELKNTYMKTTRGGIFYLGKQIFSSIGSIISSGFAGMNTVMGAGVRAAMTMAKLGFRGARNLFDMPTDVYVKGESEPVLFAVIMKNGGYFSQGTGKAITRPSMIDGPVLDRDGNVVLTKEHLKKGLVDKNGNSVGSPFMNALRFGAGVAGMGIKAAMGVARGIGKAIGGATSFGADTLEAIFKKFSFGFGGEKSYDELVTIRKILDERLTNPRKKKKNRFDKDGDGIRDGSWQDKLKNQKDKVVDKAKDLVKLGGVVTPNRKNSLDAAADTISGAYDTAKDWIGKGIDAYGDWRGTGSKDPKTIRRERAKERLKRMQKAKGGGRFSKMKDAGSKTVEAAKAAGQKIGETKGFKAGVEAGKSLASKAAQTGAGKAVSSGVTKTAGALSTIGEAAMGAGNAGASLIGKYGVKALGAAGAAYGAYSTYDNLKQGNYGAAAVDAGLTGLSVAGMVGGTAGVTGALGGAATAATAAGGTLMGAAGTALAGIGSVFSFPVVAGIAAVGAVGYGGYKLYKYLTKPNMKPLSKMRMAQYGFGQEEIDLVAKVQKFEADVQKYVKYDENGKADITIDDKNATALMGHFGFEQKDAAMVNRFTTWFQQRFKPVFVTHMTALKATGISKPLSDVDSAPAEEKKKYLNAVKFPEGPYTVYACPFPDMKLLGVGKKLVDYITKKAEEEIDKEVEKEGTKKSKLVEAGGVAAGSAESMKEKLSLTQSEIDTRNAQTMDYSFSAKLGRTVSNTLKNIIDSNAVTKSAFATMSAVSTAVTKWLGYSVEPLEAVRFKTYGLTEMDRSKVVGLRRLEEFVSTTVTFGADGKAAWNGSVDNVMSEMRYDFEVSDRSSTLAQEFAKWFSARFLPTYLNYRTFLKQSTGQDKQSSAEKLLKPNDKYEVATKVAATDVWNILFSPWEKFKLSTDVAICKPNVVLLKDSVKETTLNDPGSKVGVKSSTAPTTSPTNSSLTPGSKATEEVAKKDPNYIKTGSGISLNAPTPPDAEPKPERSGSSSLAPSVRGGGGSKITTAPGELMDGSGSEQYLAYAKDATLNRANPEMVKLFKGMVQEYGQMTGKTVTVRDGYRTEEQQAALREKKGNAAAKPGNSMHEFGLAIDIDTVVANEMEKLGLMRKYGFTRPVGGETWHIEPAGLQSVIQQAKKDPNLASQAIASSPGKGGGGWGTQRGSGLASRNPEFAKSLLNSGENAIGVANKEAAGIAPGEVNSGSKDTADKAVRSATLEGALNMKGTTPGAGMAKTVATGGSPTGIGSASQGAATNSPLYKDSAPGQSEGYSKMPGKSEGSGYMAVKDVIADASKLVGVDNKMMVQKAAIESGFNPNAKAGTSSATGLYQFTSGTWKEMMSKYASKYGIPPGTGPSDARANAILAAQYMKDNAAMLKKTTGSDPSSADLYMAHFLGPGGARTMLSADQNQIAAQLLPKAAAANQNIFYKKDGTPRTVAEMRQVLSNKVDSSLSKHGIKLDSDTIDTKLQEATGAKTPYTPQEVSKQIAPTTAAATASPNAASTSTLPTAAEMDAQLKARQQKASMAQAFTPTPTAPVQPMTPANVRITPNQIDQDVSKIMNSSLEIAKSMKTTAEQSLAVLKEIRDKLTPELFAGAAKANQDPAQDPNAVKKADPRKMEDASKPAVGYTRMT